MVVWFVSALARAGPLEDRFSSTVDAHSGALVVVCGPVRKAPPHTWLADHAGWAALVSAVRSDANQRADGDPAWERIADAYRRW